MDPKSEEQITPTEPAENQGGQTVSEQLPLPAADETANSVAVEQGISAVPGDPAAQAVTPFSPPQPSGPAPAAPAAAQPAPISAGAMPQIADDTDLIEKEWVEKAKEIVEQTAHDPHAQNQAINRVKVDYLKKRYNKDVRLTDD